MNRFLAGQLLVLLFSVACFAQPDSLWSRTYGGGEDEICLTVKQTEDGGFILGGHTESSGAGGRDFYLVRTDENGDIEWTRTYGGEYDDECYSVIQLTNGGFILVGKTLSFNSHFADGWIVRTDADGDSIWSFRTDFPTSDGFNVVQATDDGGFLVAGTVAHFDADFWLYKFSAEGDSLWSRIYDVEDENACLALAQTTDGGYLLAGYTSSPEDFSDNLFLLKADANGDSLWTRTYGRNEMDRCYAILAEDDGGYVLAGVTGSPGTSVSVDAWLIRTNSTGDSLWNRTYGGDYTDGCHSLLRDVDGGYLLGGSTSSFGMGNSDYWVLKTSEDGDSLWSRTYGGNDIEHCRSVLQTSDGDFLLAGYSRSFSSNFDYWLVKMEPDSASASRDVNTPIPAQISLSAFPNPFNSTTTITLNVPGYEREVEIAVFNTLGQIVSRATIQAAGGMVTYSNDMNGFASGIYLVRAQAGDHVAAQKIVLLK